jgi:endonuclease-8
MPEGPEIRRAADRISNVLAGRVIEKLEFAFPELHAFEAQLAGQAVRGVDTRGKAMLTRFENGLTLYSHNQLYGRWYIRRRGELPETKRSLRVALHTCDHSALLYSASDIAMLTQGQLERHPFLSRLGPDILDPSLTATRIASRLQETRFRRRRLAGLFLDQAFLAGLGNYLRSEILYCAGLDPRLRPVDLERGQRARLGRQTLAVSRRSYRTGGVTLTASLAGRVTRRGSRQARKRFWVFSRQGQTCYRCASTIIRQNHSGRRLYFCPECQSPGPANRAG